MSANTTRSEQSTTTNPGSWRMLAVLGALMASASVSTDLYLPAMPTMARELGAGQGGIEYSVSGFLVGFSLGQLLWGPLGDRYGRRLPIAIGLVLFVLGSTGCAMSDDAVTLVVWRVVQAVGACSGVVLSRAMVRDLYSGSRAAQMLSTLLTVMAIAPLVGPLVGGQILALAGWRSIFLALVLFGFLVLGALYTLPETQPADRRNTEPFLRTMLAYGSLVVNPRLMALAGAGGFFYAGLYANVAGSPFAYINYYHVPSQLYGFFFASGMVAIMTMNTLNSRLVARFGSIRLLKLGTIGAAVAGICLAITARTGVGGMWGLAAPLFVYVGCFGFIMSNSISEALVDFPNRAGSVSGLVGAIHYGSGMLGSVLIGLFSDGTPWALGWVIALSAVGSLLCGLSAHGHSTASHD